MRKHTFEEKGDKGYLIEHKPSGDEVEMTIPLPSSGGGGGGGSSQPGPNTVGSGEIKNGSIKLEDLNQEVVNRMTEVYDPGTGTLYANGSRPK